VIQALLAAGARVAAFDPEAMKECRLHHFQDRIEYAETPMDAIKGAHGLVLITEWNEFRNPNFDEVKVALAEPVVFDGRNIYPRKVLERLGFTYYGIGT